MVLCGEGELILPIVIGTLKTTKLALPKRTNQLNIIKKNTQYGMGKIVWQGKHNFIGGNG